MKSLHLSLASAASICSLNASEELPFSIKIKSGLVENDFTKNSHNEE